MTNKKADFAALFDLDGVLLNTEPAYTRFWGLMDSLYPTGVDDFEMVIKGSTLDKIFKRYFPEKTVQEDIYRRLLDWELNFEYEKFPDTDTFVTSLKERGVECVVVTSSNRNKMDEVYKQLSDFKRMLPLLICDEDVSASKPDPEGYIKGAALAGMPIERCVVFEDSIAGLEAGRRSGAKVVALATTRSKDQLDGLADIVVEHLSDLSFEKIQSLFSR